MGWLKVKASATVQPLVKFDLNHRILELLYITVLGTIQLLREDAQDSDLAFGRRTRSFIMSRKINRFLIMQNFTFQVKLLMMTRKLNPLLPRISRLMLQPMTNPKQKREKMNSRLVTPQPDFKKNVLV